MRLSPRYASALATLVVVTAAPLASATPLRTSEEVGATALPASDVQGMGGAGPAGGGGPALLHAPPASAPELSNAPSSPWRAEPLLVSGATAYRGGELVHQDFLYDDSGAATAATAAAPINAQRGPGGAYAYPTDARYGGNAADLVELRVRPLAQATAFRVTLLTMIDPSLPAVTLALGGVAGVNRAWPAGASVTSPADVFVTAHPDASGGWTADIVSAATGAALSAGTATVDLARHQVEVRVPHAAWSPGTGVQRLAAGVGLWDATASRYLVPQAQASATRPGGSGGRASPAAIVNVAFRSSEPFNRAPGPAATGDTPNAFRDQAQATALAGGDVSPFSFAADFGRLASGIDDDLAGRPDGLPRTGYLNRILVSRTAHPQGRGSATSLQPQDCKGTCVPQFAARLQPYEAYVPDVPRPRGGLGLVLDLHPAGGSHNEHLGSRRQVQLGTAGSGAVVVTPLARGGTYWYYGAALADVIEVWADTARVYRTDPERVVAAGISMGGYGALKLASLWPDAVSRVGAMVPCTSAGTSAVAGGTPSGGASSSVLPLAPSLRHVPVMAWAGPPDEFCPYGNATAVREELDRLGHRWSFWTLLAGEHLALSVLDDYTPMAAWLADTRVADDPARVTYVVNPQTADPGLGLDADSAYWVSGLVLRDAQRNGGRGTVDAVSAAYGEADAAQTPRATGAGVLTAGTYPSPYVSEERSWRAPAAATARDALRVTVANLARVVVDVERARLSCDAVVEVVTDGPVEVELAGCDRAVRAG